MIRELQNGASIDVCAVNGSFKAQTLREIARTADTHRPEPLPIAGMRLKPARVQIREARGLCVSVRGVRPRNEL
jgi:hypothetical protein